MSSQIFKEHMANIDIELYCYNLGDSKIIFEMPKIQAKCPTFIFCHDNQL
jgi:hypothetical protein